MAKQQAHMGKPTTGKAACNEPAPKLLYSVGSFKLAAKQGDPVCDKCARWANDNLE